MYLEIIKVFILCFLLKEVYGKKICDQIFDSIYTNEIFKDGKDSKDTNSYIHIMFGKETYRWELKANTISRISPVVNSEEVLGRIFIPALPACSQSGDDCQELYKLSNCAITFSRRNINEFRYKITKFEAIHQEQDCDKMGCALPWNMSASGDANENHFWPQNWANSEQLMGAYDPFSHQLIFILNAADPTKLLQKTKILRKSLTSKNWKQMSWQVDELEERHSYHGLVTLMAIDSKTNLPFRTDMDRIFAFRRVGIVNLEVWEYVNNALIKNVNYDYRSLFQCPPLPAAGSSLGLYLFVGVGIVSIIVILLIVALVIYFCRRRPITKFHLSSSSGGISSKSSAYSSGRRSQSMT